MRIFSVGFGINNVCSFSLSHERYSGTILFLLNIRRDIEYEIAELGCSHFQIAKLLIAL